MFDFLNWFHRESGIPENDGACDDAVVQTDANPFAAPFVDADATSESSPFVEGADAGLFGTSTEETSVFERQFGFFAKTVAFSAHESAVDDVERSDNGDAGQDSISNDDDSLRATPLRRDGVSFGDLSSQLRQKKGELHSMEDSLDSIEREIKDQEYKLDRDRSVLKSREDRARNHVGHDDYWSYANDVRSAASTVESRLHSIVDLKRRATSLAEKVESARRAVRNLENKLN